MWWLKGAPVEGRVSLSPANLICVKRRRDGDDNLLARWPQVKLIYFTWRGRNVAYNFMRSAGLHSSFTITQRKKPICFVDGSQIILSILVVEHFSLCICVYFSAWSRLYFCLMYLNQSTNGSGTDCCPGYHLFTAKRWMAHVPTWTPQLPWSPRPWPLEALPALESLPSMQISSLAFLPNVHKTREHFGPALVYVLFVNSELHVFWEYERRSGSQHCLLWTACFGCWAEYLARGSGSGFFELFALNSQISVCGK